MTPVKGQGRSARAGSRTMNALLRPFLLVCGCDWYGDGYSNELFKARIREWEDYAHGTTRSKSETLLTMQDVGERNFVIFGEPEYSRVISFLLRRAGVSVRRDAFVYDGKILKRDEKHGFLMAMRNPFNANKTAIVQCGIPWATGQSHNHRFDRIPDVISYTGDKDRFGLPHCGRGRLHRGRRQSALESEPDGRSLCRAGRLGFAFSAVLKRGGATMRTHVEVR